MEVAAVAPAAPAAGYGLLYLGALISFVVFWGLAHGWAKTFGHAFQWLGKKGIDITLRAAPDIHIHPFSFLLTIDREIQQVLSEGQALSERAMVWAFNNALRLIEDIGRSIEWLAHKTHDAFTVTRHTVTTTTPRVIRETIVKPLDRATRATITTLRANVSHLTHRVDALAARVGHATAVAAHAVAAPFPRIRDLERDAQAAKEWLKRHRFLARYTTLAALGAAVLAKLGVSWVRCAKSKRYGKQLCGMDTDVFEALLGASLLLTSAISLRDLARELEEPTKLVTDALHTLVREF